MKNINLIVFIFLPFLISAQEIIKDIDGNEYKTVKIGDQIWLNKNLAVTHYNNGDKIPLIADEEQWNITKSGAYFLKKDNRKSYKQTYGALYNYYVISDKRGVCPKGWKVASHDDWKKLFSFLGGEKIAGGKMRNIDSGLWQISFGDNSSGFSALPAGGKGRLGGVGEIGSFATWWASTSYNDDYAWHFGLYPNKASIRYNPGHKASGFSIRCIKNE